MCARFIAQTLGRQQRELSWVRDELLRAGDIYVPTRGRVVMSVPAFAPFLIDHYDDAREATDTPVLARGEMHANANRSVQAPRSPQLE